MHLSDHFAQVISFSMKQNNKLFKATLRRKTNEDYTYSFQRILQEIDWSFIRMENSITAYTEFHHLFLGLFNTCFPLEKIKINLNKNNIPQVYSEELGKMKNVLDALGTIAVVSKDPEAYSVYYQYKNDYKKKLISEKRKNNEERILKSDNIQKTTWTIIKEETGNQKIDHLMETELRPEEFKIYLSSLTENLLKDMPKSDNSYTTYLHTTRTDYMKSCYLEQTSPQEIKEIIRNLKEKKSEDFYGMAIKTIKAVADEISYPLALLFNKCMDEGYFPNELKIAKVVPIYKNGDGNLCENYRPISILPIISKIFEKLLKIRLMNFFEKNKIFNQEQHGFRREKSVTTAVTTVLSKIIEAYDDNDIVQIVCCDLSKAFDTVNHSILLDKLYFYGIRGNVHKLFSSYLTDRKQAVRWNGETSHLAPVTDGIPQGSVLGPILFIVYVNDILPNINCYSGCQFADDTSFLIKGNSITNVEQRSEICINNANKWMTSNKLSMNLNKTQKMVFGYTHEHAAVKFLGLKLDSRLNWSIHIQELNKKLSKAIYSIRTIKNYATHQAAKSCYYAHFHSLLSYGVIFWGQSSDASKVFILQKRALRVLCSLDQQTSCREYFKQQRILTVPALFILACLKYIHANKQQFSTNNEHHDYNTRNKNQFSIPHRRLKMTQQGVGYWGPTLYNVLPDTIKNLSNSLFCKKIKSSLINNTVYTIEDYVIIDFNNSNTV